MGLSRRSLARSRWRVLAMLCIAPALSGCWATLGAAVLTTTLQIGANALKLDTAVHEWAHERQLEKAGNPAPAPAREGAK